MTTEHARVARLRRVERVRAIEKQLLTGHAAEAERMLAQLGLLASRTERIADDYAVRTDAHDAASLRRLRGFAVGLQSISADTAVRAESARVRADGLAVELAEAERRHGAISERADRGAAALERRTSQRAHADLARSLNRLARS